MKQLINALDDAQTWGGLGTVFEVPDKFVEALNDSDDLMLELPVKPDAPLRVHISEVPGVKAYDVRALLKYYLHQKRVCIPRNPKTRRLLMAVEAQ